MHKVFMTAATPDRPAQLGRSDNLPKAYGRLEPRAAQVQGPTGSGVSKLNPKTQCAWTMGAWNRAPRRCRALSCCTDRQG